MYTAHGLNMSTFNTDAGRQVFRKRMNLEVLGASEKSLNVALLQLGGHSTS